MTPRIVFMRCVCALGAAYYLIVGSWLFFIPRSFFITVFPEGPYNAHYVGDLGSFVLPLGLALAVAMCDPRKYWPFIAVAVSASTLHVVNHLRDGLSTSALVLTDASLALVAVLLIAGLPWHRKASS